VHILSSPQETGSESALFKMKWSSIFASGSILVALKFISDYITPAFIEKGFTMPLRPFYTT